MVHKYFVLVAACVLGSTSAQVQWRPVQYAYGYGDSGQDLVALESSPEQQYYILPAPSQFPSRYASAIPDVGTSASIQTSQINQIGTKRIPEFQKIPEYQPFFIPEYPSSGVPAVEQVSLDNVAPIQFARSRRPITLQSQGIEGQISTLGLSGAQVLLKSEGLGPSLVYPSEYMREDAEVPAYIPFQPSQPQQAFRILTRNPTGAMYTTYPNPNQMSQFVAQSYLEASGSDSGTSLTQMAPPGTQPAPAFHRVVPKSQKISRVPQKQQKFVVLSQQPTYQHQRAIKQTVPQNVQKSKPKPKYVLGPTSSGPPRPGMVPIYGPAGSSSKQQQYFMVNPGDNTVQAVRIM